MKNVEVRVETVDNRLYVSESSRTPGYTHKAYYPVEHQLMGFVNGIFIVISCFCIAVFLCVAYDLWKYMRNTRKQGKFSHHFLYFPMLLCGLKVQSGKSALVL